LGRAIVLPTGMRPTADPVCFLPQPPTAVFVEPTGGELSAMPSCPGAPANTLPILITSSRPHMVNINDQVTDYNL